MFLSQGKVKLNGALSVVNRYCGCCQGKDFVDLLDDEGSPMYYCQKCFSTNCDCNGTKVLTEEK